jgi:hypothetical protein
MVAACCEITATETLAHQTGVFLITVCQFVTTELRKYSEFGLFASLTRCRKYYILRKLEIGLSNLLNIYRPFLFLSLSASTYTKKQICVLFKGTLNY